MSKIEIYKSAFNIFLKNQVPNDILKAYLEDEDGEASYKLQDFVVNNLKEEITWSTGIGVLDAVDIMYEEALSNGNIK